MSKWAQPIADFEAAQREAGLQASTAAWQARQLRTLAVQLGGSPWDVAPAALTGWLARHPGSPLTVKAYRNAIRAFYQWAVKAEHVTESPAPALEPVTRYRLEQRWQDALASFEVAQLADGLAASTVEIRVKHVTRLAVYAAGGPWQLSSEELQSWLDALTCGDVTRQAHRVSVTAFYRWAVRTGRRADDPSWRPSGRALALPTPPLWIDDVNAYRSYFRATGRATTTTETRVNQMRRFARDHASLAPFDVTLDDLLEWLGGKRWANETRRNMHAALTSFYDWAESTGRTDRNPTEKLPSVRASQPRPRPALDHEYRDAFERADARETLALRLAAELGLRCAEVAVVHSRDIMGEQGAWSLVVHGKGDKRRTLPLPRGLAAQLRALPEGYVFPGRDRGHLSPRYLGKLISRLLPKGVTMHALRHRFATLAYGIDRDVFTVQQLLGHASPATTQRYVQVTDNNMRRLVDRLAS